MVWEELKVLINFLSPVTAMPEADHGKANYYEVNGQKSTTDIDLIDSFREITRRRSPRGGTFKKTQDNLCELIHLNGR